MSSSPDVTELLAALSGDGAPADEAVLDRLLPVVYDELRRVAHGLRLRERPDHTLNTTELVHEAYFKLVDGSRAGYDSRAHFFGAAARAMRQVLVDYARARHRKKRRGAAPHLNLDDAPALLSDARAEELLALDESLRRLEAFDPRQSRVVECRYFAGLTLEETAEVLRLSPSTVKREWRTARAWLAHDLQREA
ncbi:MAG: ECF-type sigma factor [Bacteroidota bacterium]